MVEGLAGVANLIVKESIFPGTSIEGLILLRFKAEMGRFFDQGMGWSFDPSQLNETFCLCFDGSCIPDLHIGVHLRFSRHSSVVGGSEGGRGVDLILDCCHWRHSPN